MSDWGRDYGDENDYVADEDDFILDIDFWDEEDDDEDYDDDNFGTLVPNEPSDSGPFLSASAIVEEEYIFS